MIDSRYNEETILIIKFIFWDQYFMRDHCGNYVLCRSKRNQSIPRVYLGANRIMFWHVYHVHYLPLAFSILACWCLLISTKYKAAADRNVFGFAFFLMACKERFHWFRKDGLYVSLWENDPAPHLIYHLSKQFPHQSLVSVASFKSSSTQQHV